jgi:reactive chlorine resistance protein C
MTSYADRIEKSMTGASFVEAVGTAGVRIMRYGLVFLLVMWGAAKFTTFEAEAIMPLVDHSPLLAWLHNALGLRGTSALFGVFEMSAGLLIATRRWLPRVSGFASLATAGMFIVTLSFLVTTPGVLQPTSPWGGFLMKDIELLGAALFTFAEAVLAERGATRG